MQLLSEQELERRKDREELYSLGINPYPAESFVINATAEDIHKNYENSKTDYKDISIAGRLMSRRIMGKASFAELKDASGRMQIYINRDEISSDDEGTMYNTVFKKLLDMGDIIGIKGDVFKTKVGEVSVNVKELSVLSKSLRPLPVVKTDADGKIHDAFSDAEQRYRRRYVDLIVNDHVKETFIKRTKITNSMRDFFNKKGYLEVETPILQPIPGGAAARPFMTHHNALDMPLYLRIANELYLKRLIVGGFDAVYEFAKDFRNEVVNWVLRARSNYEGKNPPWTAYEKMKEVIEHKMFAGTEELLPVISFGSKKTKEDQSKHDDFIDRMTEKGYTAP